MLLLYAGIGSRLTPEGVCVEITEIAKRLKTVGFILRSGGANGADTAFELGAGNKSSIFTPWATYRQSPIKLARDIVFTTLPKDIQAKMVTTASMIHPNWGACSSGARLLHARNVAQIWGADYNTPVDFVVYWARVTGDQIAGGTRQAVEIARKANIPTYNLNVPEQKKAFYDMLSTYQDDF